VIETCTGGSDGCLGWVGGTDCDETGDHCDDSGDEAVCLEGCADECLPAGGTQCSGTVIQTCTAGTDGCTDWVDGTDCDDGDQVCDVSVTGAACADACTSTCTTVDDTRCHGTVIQTCTAGTDGCNDWVNGTDCATTSEACDDVSGPAACVTPCTGDCTGMGDTQCASDVLQICGLEDDGCTYWEEVVDCSLAGYSCEIVSGDAYCIAECTSECDTPGGTQCASDRIQTCTANIYDGCNYWVDTTDCTTSSEICRVVSGTATCVTLPPILLLGDDVSSTEWDKYRAALTAAGVTWDEWNLDSLSFPTPPDLAGYPVLIWFDEDTITPDNPECQVVADWLALGGKSIFMTGIDFFWDFYSGTTGLGEHNLYVLFETTYMGDYAGSTVASIAGVTGDPVTGSFDTTPLGLSMTGDSSGDYANETLGLSVKAGIYTGGSGSGLTHAAITHYDSGTYKTVWLGVNFHNGLSDASQQATLMDNVLTYFGL
jgi:hypothetical protein